MNYDSHVDAVEIELAATVAAVASGRTTADVPTCPGFTVADLITHVGEFCGFWTHVLCEGTGRPKTPYQAVGDEPLASWLELIGGHLVSELRATPAVTATYTWYEPDQSASFVARRCCHELAVHRVDAELAHGAAGVIDAAVAADGVDEALFLAREHGVRGEAGIQGSGQTLHIHGTDFEPAEWLVRLDSTGISYTTEHVKADLAIRGAVSDLEMVLYQRRVVGSVEFLGDRSVLEVFHGVFTFGDRK